MVGGAVRDALLGRDCDDRDFVVVGETPESMLAAGYKPIGESFPVFLHPKTGEEYALARTEKKHGRGHRGFIFYAAPEVSLEDDLCRRDLTINAMARGEDGVLIDPFGGARDIEAKVLRHVSPAFVEDPLRIFRVARFAAMFPDFTVADDTHALMSDIVRDGEAAELSVERVYAELERGFAAARPSRMLQVLHDCGALAVVLPELAALDGVPERKDYHPEGDSFIHTMMTLDAAAELGLSAAECFAAALHDIGKATTPPSILPSHHGHEARGAKMAAALCARLRVPRRFADLAVLSCAEHGNVHNAEELRPGTLVDLLLRLDVFRRPARAESVLRVCEADYAYWPARRGTEYPQGAFVRRAWAAAASIDTGAVAKHAAEKHGNDAEQISAQIRQERIKAIRQFRQAEIDTDSPPSHSSGRERE